MTQLARGGALTVVMLLLGQQQVACWWFGTGTDAPKEASKASAQIARAHFDLDGAKGYFKFTQNSPNEPTLIEYDLVGLKGNNKLYHVHVRPVPAFDAERVRHNATAIAQLCGDPATGGHLNPHKVTAKLPPKSAPLDQYETGDLSGKHGPLVAAADQADHYVGKFRDDKLPMTGENKIVGRSVVIHKNDGKRWICASIVPADY